MKSGLIVYNEHPSLKEQSRARAFALYEKVDQVQGVFLVVTMSQAAHMLTDSDIQLLYLLPETKFFLKDILAAATCQPKVYLLSETALQHIAVCAQLLTLEENTIDHHMI